MKFISLRFCAFLLAASAGLMLGGAGCASGFLPLDSARVSSWKGDRMSGSPSVRISLSQQRAFFYKGGQLAGVSLISSGREGLDTVTGRFRILEKDREHRSSLFGNYLNAP